MRQTMKDVDITRLLRQTHDDPQQTLFGIEPSWKESWWGMPAFEMKDAQPQYKITINFMAVEDVHTFAKKTGLPVTTQSDTAWFPHQEHLKGEFYYDGPPTNSKYPICIPSKGRWDCQTTGKILDRLGVKYHFLSKIQKKICTRTMLGRIRLLYFHFTTWDKVLSLYEILFGSGARNVSINVTGL